MRRRCTSSVSEPAPTNQLAHAGFVALQVTDLHQVPTIISLLVVQPKGLNTKGKPKLSYGLSV